MSRLLWRLGLVVVGGVGLGILQLAAIGFPLATTVVLATGTVVAVVVYRRVRTPVV